jgi:ABC-type transporter Mla subunit MlaD
MPDDLFRLVVAIAVMLSCIAFLVQAFMTIALYRVGRQVQQKLAPLIEKGDDAVARAVPMIDRVGPLLDNATVVIQQAGPIMDHAKSAVERATHVVATAGQILEEVRPRVAEVSSDCAAITKSGREQVERLGNLLHDASDRARERLGQIDRSVDNTVEQVEQVSEAVKRAALRPVREVNGLAAGISAAISTLVHGTRRSSVDHATQDEEMFI